MPESCQPPRASLPPRPGDPVSFMSGNSYRKSMLKRWRISNGLGPLSPRMLFESWGGFGKPIFAALLNDTEFAHVYMPPIWNPFENRRRTVFCHELYRELSD